MGTITKQAKEIFDIEINGLLKIKNLIDGSFEKLVTECTKVLDNGGKIVLSGIGKSGHIARKTAATLASTGSHATFMHPVEAMHGDLGILQKKDLLLALSYSGETEELLTILPSAKRLNIPIASITGNPKSRLAKWSDIVISIPIDKEACPFNLAPTTSTTAQLVLGDALSMVLLQNRGFTKEDFGRIHPGGAIGRSVTLKITDIMRSEKTHRLVKILPSETVKNTILAMTKAKSGSAIVIDKKNRLLGVFTDGDLRRHIDDLRMLEKPVEKYMTVEPITVFSDQMAVNVLNLIEEKRVDDIVVIDRDNRVVGIVDSQDLPGLKLM